MRLARVLLPFALVAGLPFVTSDPAAADTLTARGSVNQVQVEGATPGATVELRQGSTVVGTGVVDDAGTFIFGIDPGTQDDVPRGSGYTVVEGAGDPVAVTAPAWAPVEVVDPGDTPPQSFYDDQVLPVPAYATTYPTTGDDGYGYITTRDGTTLSANILAPFNVFGSPPPYRAIVIYSGYEPSAPAVQGDPDDALATLLRISGYAVVSVNIRGTGCSGGAYSYWEPLQGLDGYDVIEAVAAQPWVSSATALPGFDDGGPRVGMAGISFGGISQLFVARTNPPSLAGITPLSVIADTYRSTLYPGGILNDGFARGWAAEREVSAEPAGSPWAAQRIQNGDSQCEANQRYKRQAPPLVARFEQDLLYQPDPGDSLAPETFVDEIDVPTFIAGSFQDEQTGGHWSTMLQDFDTPTEVANGTDDLKRAVLYNGTHADALGPDVVRDLLEFLDLYVARGAPGPKPVLRSEAPPAFADVFGAAYALPPNRAAQFPTQDAYEAADDVVLRWERGTRDAPECRVDTNTSPGGLTEVACNPNGQGDGAPFGRFETTYPSWPPPEVQDDQWFLQPDGGLAETAATVPDGQARSWSSYRHETDPGRTQVTTHPSDDWHKDATYTWTPAPESDSLRFESPPLASTRAYAGRGSVRLWLRSTAPDVDLEVLLTEVRDDGQETLIQSGWLRASNRAEAPGSTALAPRQTHLAHEPLPAGEFTPVRVELFPFAHVIRGGSRIALTVSAPGGNRPGWTFDSPDDDDATVNDIAHSAGWTSVLDLPEVTTPAATPSTRPVCGDLRSQPCRTTPLSTRPTAVAASLDPGDTATDLDRGIDVTWAAPATAGVTGNGVVGVPTGSEWTDTDADPGFRIPVAVGAPPPTDRAVRVRSTFAQAGQPSDASPDLVPPHPYADVSRRAWNVDAVDWVAGWQLADGFADGTFRNAAQVTRGQFVSWLWTMFGRPSGSPAHGFADVRPNAWMAGALSWAKAEGIVGGLPGNRFAPDRPINRAQIAQWLWVAAGRPDGAPASGFADVPVDAWYGPAVDWAEDAGVVAGFAGNQFRPTANATRGQAASWFLATATWVNTALG